MDNPYWSELVRGLAPYVPGEQPRQSGLVKLNTNENPFPPSPRVIEAIRRQADDGLRLYPPPESDQLRATIAAYYSVGADQVFVGNGSDEVLAHIFQAFFSGRAEPVLFPDITYSFYPVYCQLYGVGYRQVPLGEDFSIQPESLGGANGGIIFPNPNAPTGIALGLDQVEAVVSSNRESVVVVDEAYVDFGARSATALVARYPNLIVVQTLSKSRSLAGLRVGFAIGDAGLIEGLARVKNSFNSYPLDRLAIAGAVAAFEDDGYFRRCRDAVIAERDRLAEALSGRGFEVLPSAANFLFVRHRRETGAALAAALRKADVIVRHFDKARIGDFLRITVGTAEQHDRLLAALDDIPGVGRPSVL